MFANLFHWSGSISFAFEYWWIKSSRFEILKGIKLKKERKKRQLSFWIYWANALDRDNAVWFNSFSYGCIINANLSAGRIDFFITFILLVNKYLEFARLHQKINWEIKDVLLKILIWNGTILWSSNKYRIYCVIILAKFFSFDQNK